ncbi:MAG: hypothetical protein DI537_45425 [Stutzerimonas stutzeri]|nr:MAG: hypothetical protein DI537_45425 [Stutzerimonas stutzeri]
MRRRIWWILGAAALLFPVVGVFIVVMLFAIGSAGAGLGGAGNGGAAAAFPLEQPMVVTSSYGVRDCPVFTDAGACATSDFHVGVDLQNNWPDSCGQPVYAVLPGTVVLSNELWLSIRHADGFVISYLHMYQSQRRVDVGDVVQAGQRIGSVGNVAPSSGCHLDLRVNVTNNTNSAVAALPQSTVRPGWVNPEDFMRLFDVDLCPPDSCQRLD